MIVYVSNQKYGQLAYKCYGKPVYKINCKIFYILYYTFYILHLIIYNIYILRFTLYTLHFTFCILLHFSFCILLLPMSQLTEKSNIHLRFTFYVLRLHVLLLHLYLTFSFIFYICYFILLFIIINNYNNNYGFNGKVVSAFLFRTFCHQIIYPSPTIGNGKETHFFLVLRNLGVFLPSFVTNSKLWMFN